MAEVMRCWKHNSREEQPPLAECRKRAKRGCRAAFWARGMIVVGLGLGLLSTGCDRLLRVYVVEKEEGKEHSVSYNAADSEDGIDVSGNLEALTEENALKAYFKGKKLLSMAYFAKTQAQAKQYSAEAEKWFQRGLRFYVPDIEAMTAGKKPIHASANWEFLKGLHEAWSESITLSGKRLASREHIDRNAKDAWALSVISRMIQNEGNEQERRELIAGKFSEIREILGSNDKYARQLMAKKEAADRNRSTAAASKKEQTSKPPAVAASVSMMAKANVAPAKVALDQGLVGEDPVTGKASFSMKIGPGQTGTVTGVSKAKEPAVAEVRRVVVPPQPVSVSKKDVEPQVVQPASSRGVAFAEGTKPHVVSPEPQRFFPSQAKIYIGDRLHVLPPSSGKLYIGDRIHTLPPQEKPQSSAGR